jgi:membrane protein YdbS with pleckstrin-like domain
MELSIVGILTWLGRHIIPVALVVFVISACFFFSSPNAGLEWAILSLILIIITTPTLLAVFSVITAVIVIPTFLLYRYMRCHVHIDLRRRHRWEISQAELESE